MNNVSVIKDGAIVGEIDLDDVEWLCSENGQEFDSFVAEVNGDKKLIKWETDGSVIVCEEDVRDIITLSKYIVAVYGSKEDKNKVSIVIMDLYGDTLRPEDAGEPYEFVSCEKVDTNTIKVTMETCEDTINVDKMDEWLLMQVEAGIL